jgi:hypothetical protein
MAKCWETRGCDDEMMSTCPHNSPGEKCPARCAFAACERPTHKLSSDPAVIFDPTTDRRAAIKEQCTFCEFFLTNGPAMPTVQ